MTTTFLGFDFGTRYIGVAVGRMPGLRCEPVKSIPARAGIPDWVMVDRLVTQWHPDVLVVGLPVHMDGSHQPLTRAARQFGQSLQSRYNRPVAWADERLTTRVADAELAAAGIPGRSRKAHLDPLAACLLLEGYLAGLAPHPGERPPDGGTPGHE